MHQMIVLLLLAVLIVGAVLVGSETSCGLAHAGDTVALVCRSPLFGRP